MSCSTPEHIRRRGGTAGLPSGDGGDHSLATSRFVFLGVKPQMMAGLAKELAGDIACSDAIFVSMLAGISLDRLAELLGADKKIIRIMPNTPCAVGKGLTCTGQQPCDGGGAGGLPGPDGGIRACWTTCRSI